jgi:hypothetical protein
MRRLSYLILIAGLVVAAYGCKKKEEAAATTAPATEESAAGGEEATEEAKEPAAEEASGEAAGGEIGVPECDEYVSKYEGCLKEKVPEASRAAMLDAFAKTRESWKKMAENEATKAGLAQACKQAMEAAKTSMKSMGCEF